MINTCKYLKDEHGMLFVESVKNAVQRFYNTHKNELLVLNKRTKACLINDYIYDELIRKLCGCKDFNFITKGNKRFILYKKFFVMKIKKLNQNFRASFIPTKSAVQFNSQEQLEFFNSAENIYFGYVMDDYDSEIDKILFVCPDNSDQNYKWIVDLDNEDIVANELAFDNTNEVIKENRFRKNNKGNKQHNNA